MRKLSDLRRRRWTRLQYERLVDRGVLGPDDPVELLDGVLIVREPQGSRHAAVVGHVGAVLERAFGDGYHVREEKPFALDPASEPEPDLVVMSGRHLDYLEGHPSRPVLVVEVAETSLALDRLRKGSLYARAGVADYWIVNLRRGVLEVYREPRPAAASRYGWEYGSVRLLKRDSVISPLARSDVRLRVSDLLP